MTKRRLVVLKFGGAALAHPDAVVARVREARTNATPVVIVVSARESVTDRLQICIDQPRNRSYHRRVLSELATRHLPLSSAEERVLDSLRSSLSRAEVRGSCNPAETQDILASGERLAVHWLAGVLTRGGLRAVPVEADVLGLRSEEAHGAPLLLLERSAPAVRRGLKRILRRNRIPIVTGFIARGHDRNVRTLGRGGSDYSAAAIGAILDAARVELVKGRASVLTADPSQVPAARPISHLSYEEAEELAQFGARVLHPLTIEPARAKGTELWVRSLSHPQQATVIGPDGSDPGVRALTCLRHMRLLRLRVPGGRQRPGVVAEMASRLAARGINLVTVFTSSALLSVVVEAHHGRRARAVLEPMARHGAAVLEGPRAVTLVTAIGEGVLGGFDRWPAEIMRPAEGFSATSRSLSLAVPDHLGDRAVRVLHRLLVEPGGR